MRLGRIMQSNSTWYDYFGSQVLSAHYMALAEQAHAMEVDFQDISELQQFVVANVESTDKTLGVGAYGRVEEVKIPGAICAAKKIHDILLDTDSEDDIKNISPSEKTNIPQASYRHMVPP